MVEFQILSFAR